MKKYFFLILLASITLASCSQKISNVKKKEPATKSQFIEMFTSMSKMVDEPYPNVITVRSRTDSCRVYLAREIKKDSLGIRYGIFEISTFLQTGETVDYPADITPMASTVGGEKFRMIVAMHCAGNFDYTKPEGMVEFRKCLDHKMMTAQQAATFMDQLARVVECGQSNGAAFVAAMRKQKMVE